MWDQRNDPELFYQGLWFIGDNSRDIPHPDSTECGDGKAGKVSCDENMAAAPWAFDDAYDIPGRGYIAANPVDLVWRYFNWPGKLANRMEHVEYSRNPYNGKAPEAPKPETPTEQPGDPEEGPDIPTEKEEKDFDVVTPSVPK